MTHFQTPWGHSKQQHRSIVPWLWQKAFAQLGMLALISPISAAGLLRVTLPITTCQTQRSLHMAPCPEWHVCVHVFILASRVCANMSILPPIVPLVNQCICEKKTNNFKTNPIQGYIRRCFTSSVTDTESQLSAKFNAINLSQQTTNYNVWQLHYGEQVKHFQNQQRPFTNCFLAKFGQWGEAFLSLSFNWVRLIVVVSGDKVEECRNESSIRIVSSDW